MVFVQCDSSSIIGSCKCLLKKRKWLFVKHQPDFIFADVSSSSSSSSSPSSPSSSSSSSSPSQSSSYFSKFRAGYLECVSEVNRYLTTVEKLDACVYERLRRHLLVRLRQVEDLSTATERISLTDVKIEDSDSRNSPNVTTTTPTTPSPSPSPSSTLSSSCSQVTVDSTSSVPSITSLGLSVSCTEALAGVAVIPSRLSTGQLAFVVPTKEYLQYINKFGPPTIHDLTLMRGHESSSSFSGLSSSSSSSSTSPSSSSLSLTSLMMTSSTSQCPEVPNPRVVRLIEPTWGGDRTNVWRPW